MMQYEKAVKDYEDAVKAIPLPKTEKIQIGRFTLTFRWSPNQYLPFDGYGFAWDKAVPNDFYESPEEQYFQNIADEMDASREDKNFVDFLIQEIQNNPFTQGETL